MRVDDLRNLYMYFFQLPEKLNKLFSSDIIK